MAVCFTDISDREAKWREDRIDRYLKLRDELGFDERFVADYYAMGGGAAERAGVHERLRRSDAARVGAMRRLLDDVLDDYANPELRDEHHRLIADTLVPGANLVQVIYRDGKPLVLPATQVGNNGNPRNAALSASEELFFRVTGYLDDHRFLVDPERRDRVRGGGLTRADVRAAQGWVEDTKALFDAALPEIREQVLTHDGIDFVFAAHWANAVDRMHKDGITAKDPYIKQVIEESMRPFLGLTADGSAGHGGGVLGGLGGQRPSWIGISLPDLDAEADLDIVENNLMAMQAIYFSATLEDLRFFQVMDKVLELFNLGVLPFGKGTAGDKIYGYWKRNFDRFTEVERHNLYARALGKPGGDPGMGSPNRQFHDLWLRFISSVSEWRRQIKVDSLLRDGTPYIVSGQQVRKSARDLASNLSLYGYGIAYFAATELQQQIRDVISILSDAEVRSSYGARDMWQVIDQVATLELGGARNSVRYRTMANSGAIIIRWLAKNSRELARPTYRPLLQESDLTPPETRGDPLDDPTNFDLIEACEQYLAVTGTSEARIEEYSQPTLGPDLTSRPIQIPGVARDMFESVGVNPGDFGLN